MCTTYRTTLAAFLVAALLDASGGGQRLARAATVTAPTARVLLSASGSGIANTRRFRVPGTWRIDYRFSGCQIPGLSIYVKGGPDDIATDDRNSGAGTQYEYGSGSVYLTMNTACNWHVTVYSGRWVVNGPGLSIGGNGITNTVAFRVPSEWKIHYAFRKCSVPGFSIYVHGGGDDIVSRQGRRGNGVQYEHSGGTISLTINTACFWQLRITR